MRTKKFAAVSMVMIIIMLMVTFTSVAADIGSDDNQGESFKATDLVEGLAPKNEEEEVPEQVVDLAAVDFAMANIADEAMVYSEASESSEVVGKIFATTSCQVITTNDEWTCIKSGNLEGYIQSSKLMFGDEGRVLRDAKCVHKAVIEADTALYDDSQNESGIIVCAGEEFVVKQQLSGWYKLGVDDAEYLVPASAMRTEAVVQNGMTVAEIAAEEEAIRQAEAAIASGNYQQAAQIIATTGTSSSTVQYVNNGAYSASKSQLDLLAALIFCEAGTNYEGGVAVGSVVMNRMRDDRFPSDLEGVIFQSGQFTPALNGKVYRVMASGVPDVCYEAAQQALDGNSNVGDCLWFRGGSGDEYTYGGATFRSEY